MITRNELDQDLLASVVAESLTKVATAKDAARWTNAIAKATVQLETNPFMTYDQTSHSLLVLSETSGEIYTANGTCQCKAFAAGQPCWHRAAARIVTRYIERAK